MIFAGKKIGLSKEREVNRTSTIITAYYWAPSSAYRCAKKIQLGGAQCGWWNDTHQYISFSFNLNIQKGAVGKFFVCT